MMFPISAKRMIVLIDPFYKFRIFNKDKYNVSSPIDTMKFRGNDEERYGKISNPTVHIALNQTRTVVNAIIKEYGKPCLAKIKSSALNTYHKNIDSPFEKARAFQAITGIRLKDWKAPQ